MAGLLVQRAVIDGSVAEGGTRRCATVAALSADWSGFVSRHAGPLEEFTLLGWLVPLLAIAGVVVLVTQRSPRLAILLGLGVVVPAAARTRDEPAALRDGLAPLPAAPLPAGA